MAHFQFDATRHTAAVNAGLVPAGRYEATIIDSLSRMARSGDGRYLQFCIQIERGEHAGRVIFVRLHVGSSNASVRQLSEQELAALCEAISVPRFTSTNELHGKRLVIDVGYKQRGGSDCVNVVKAYHRLHA